MITGNYTGINPIPMFFYELEREALTRRDFATLLAIFERRKGRVFAVYHPEAHIFPEEQATAMAQQASKAISELEEMLRLLTGSKSEDHPGDKQLAAHRFDQWVHDYLRPSKDTSTQSVETGNWRWESLAEAQSRIRSLEMQVRDLSVKLGTAELMASKAVGKGTVAYNAAMVNIEETVKKIEGKMHAAEEYASQGNWAYIRLNIGPAATIARRNNIDFEALYGARRQEIIRMYMRTRIAQGEKLLDKVESAIAQGVSGVRNFSPSYNNFSRAGYDKLFRSVINAAGYFGMEQEARTLISPQAERFVEVARKLGELRTELNSRKALFETADYIQRQYVQRTRLPQRG